VKLVRDKTKAKSKLFWECHAIADCKKEMHMSVRELAKYWSEKPYFKWRLRMRARTGRR